MTRLVRRRLARKAISDSHLYLLAHGCWWPFMDEGEGSPWNWDKWGELSPEARGAVDAEMRAAYFEHQEEVEQIHQEWCGNSWSKSWAWWKFARPEPRNTKLHEWHQLHQLGLLDTETARELARKQWASPLNHSPWQADWFRRTAGWWEFVSVEPRDVSVCEVAQLVRTKQLTEWEQKVVDGDFTDLRRRYSGAKGQVPPQLTQDELRLLGLSG